MLTFTHISNPVTKLLLERVEGLREAGNHDQAITELKRFITALKILKGGSAATLVALSAAAVYLYNTANPEENVSEPSETDLMRLFGVASLTAVGTAAGMAMKSAIDVAIKEASTYLCYVYKENKAKKTKYYWSHREEFQTQKQINQFLGDDDAGVQKMYEQAIYYAGLCGYNSSDGLLLWLSSKFDYNVLAPDRPISQTVANLLNAGADVNTTIPGMFEGESLVWSYAIESNWNKVAYLIDMYPNLNLDVYPRTGTWAGHTVFIHAALDYRWDIVEKLIDNEKVDINVIIQGSGSFIHMKEWVGKTALWFIANAGQSDLVVKLINKGAIVDEATLNVILEKCNVEAAKALISNGLFKPTQINNQLMEKHSVMQLLPSVILFDEWGLLKKIILENSDIDDTMVKNIAKAASKNKDQRLLILIELGRTDYAKKIIKDNLKREVAESPIVNILLQYSLDVIDAYLALDANVLQDMFSPISHKPVILNPVRIGDDYGLEGPTHTLYELSELKNWINSTLN